MMVSLDLPPITIDRGELNTTDSREPFDQLGYEMLARSGQMAEQIVESVRRCTPPTGLSLDEAVIGGLLVRTCKLTRGIFDSTQAEESEAHLVLGRCAAETAITLRWLARRGNSGSFVRFRADSYAYFRREIDRMQETSEDEDDVARVTRELVEANTDREMEAAGVSWEDVPKQSNSWGPDLRQRFVAFDQEWIYFGLFASHSTYVHPSWHELRAFHLATEDGGIRLDPTFGGMAPVASYLIARLVVEAAETAVDYLPADLDPADVVERVRNTIRASQLLAMAFSEFVARGGVADGLARHLDASPPSRRE